MLSPWWWLPLAVAAAAVFPLWRGVRRLEREASALRHEIVELSEVRPIVRQVRLEIAAIDTARRGTSDLAPR